MFNLLGEKLYLMQTVQTVIWVYTVRQYPFYGTQGKNGLRLDILCKLAA